MDDMISRQQAIDALCDNCDTVDAVCAHYPCKRYLSIENLPSIQQCDTCRYAGLEWDEEPCDSCTRGGETNHYKPSVQPESKRKWYMKGYRDAQQKILRWAKENEGDKMKTFEIYFSDLNEDAQDRLLKAVGAESPVEMNWDMDICPIAMYDFEEDSPCNDCYGCEHKEKQE